MSNEAQQGEIKNPFVKWGINIALFYLGGALAMKFLIYTETQLYNDIINHCGQRSAYCACQAQGVADQYTLLNAPLWAFGIYTPRDVASACARHLN